MATAALPLTRPDDWQLHLRYGDALAAVLPDIARRFARAMVMPNLDLPERTVDEVRERIPFRLIGAGDAP